MIGEHDRKSGRRWVGLAAACALVACERRDDNAELVAARGAEIQVSWHRFAGCLLGDPPTEGEPASTRMRKIEIGLASGGPASEWPQQCDGLRDELLKTITALTQISKKGPSQAYQPLSAALQQLQGTSPRMYLAGDEPQVDEIWKAAAKVGLLTTPPGKPAEKDLRAPRPDAPASLKQLAKLGPASDAPVRLELVPGGKSLNFMTGAGDKGLFCSLEAGDKGPHERVHCVTVGRAVGEGSRPLSTFSAQASHYWDDGEKSVVWALAGASFEAPFSASTVVTAEGELLDVVATRRGLSLVRAKKGSPGRAGTIMGPPGGRYLGFRAGIAMWRGPRSGTAGLRPFLLQDLGAETGKPGARVNIGTVPYGVETLEACRTGSNLAIAILGSDPKRPKGDNPLRPAAMIFRHGGKWSRPVGATIGFGAKPHPSGERWWRTLTCDDKGAVLTWVRPDRQVGQLRCDPAGCTTSLSKGPVPGRAKDKFRVATLGDKVLLVRATRAILPISGMTEAVTMRFAPLEKLSQSSEHVIVAGEAHGGPKSLRRRIGLVATSSAAVALIRAGEDTYGLRIAADGSLGSLEIVP